MPLRLMNMETHAMSFANLSGFQSSKFSQDVRDFSNLLRGGVSMIDFPSTAVWTVDYYRQATDAGEDVVLNGDVYAMNSKLEPVRPIADLMDEAIEGFDPARHTYMTIRSWRDAVLTVLYFVNVRGKHAV